MVFLYLSYRIVKINSDFFVGLGKLSNWLPYILVLPRLLASQKVKKTKKKKNKKKNQQDDT